MVKRATFLLATAVSLVASRLCKNGLRYCASTLLEIGNYQQQIHRELDTWSPCTATTDNYLYYCDEGDIHLVGNCQWGCDDSGVDESDSCSPNFKEVVDCNLWYGNVANEWEKKGLRGI
ncbi:hypothetical protein G6O67_000173 [Ophiocordyceps sinensis]|uniref:Uncharacterized protein n=2 Tax=Ophiocordyceps sinensis TaxID=72228 RepID=A0A8H4PYN3_9HYPO|nr:hypothetical protein OCS_05104 [Ophiocordyceps sinensis CO18]KAF4512836.1 hypothetical protein G6O67_000173 [Ophiocordyceps sinensis]